MVSASHANVSSVSKIRKIRQYFIIRLKLSSRISSVHMRNVKDRLLAHSSLDKNCPSGGHDFFTSDLQRGPSSNRTLFLESEHQLYIRRIRQFRISTLSHAQTENGCKNRQYRES
eukprot:Filipodium_phascolosomae@DN3152_c0_g1_i1.p1